MLEEDVRLTDIDHTLNRLDFEPTLKYIERGWTLLDVGCGRGTYILYLKKHRPSLITEGVDHNREYVNLCVSKGLNVKLGNASNLDYPIGSFDIVTSFHVLEHLPDDFKVLNKLIEIARSRVLLILPKTIIQLSQLPSIETYHYLPFYTKLGLDRLLAGITCSVYPHYAPTGVFESWMVVIDV